RGVRTFIICVAASLSLLYWSFHFVTGMDTTFAMAYAALYLLTIERYFAAGRWAWGAAAALVGGFAFAARPDLMVFTIAVPLWLACFDRSTPNAGRRWVIVLLTGAAVSLAVAATAQAYFGSAVPLSFHAKVGGLYGPFIHKQYQYIPLRQFIYFVMGLFPFFGVISANLCFSLMWRRSSGSCLESGLVISIALFLAYYLFFVLQIMSYRSRFYCLSIPALAYVAGRSLDHIMGGASGFRDRIERTVNRRAFMSGVTVLVLIAGVASSGYAYLQARKNPACAPLSFDLKKEYEARWSGYWPLLPEISSLPDDLVIATTEVGRVAAFNPGKRVIDLAGLNDTSIALNGFREEYVFGTRPPDVIFMPHPHYKELIEAIEACPYFKRHYDSFTGGRMNSLLGLSLWRHSKYHARLKNLVDGTGKTYQ
ncbi:MAG: hypothetical protein V2B18_24195, partial [Pseudomonadota bacterium]